jgi:hypothetical protein
MMTPDLCFYCVHYITVETKIPLKKKIKMINRAQRLFATTLSSTSNKDEAKRIFYDIFKELF